MNIDTEPTGDDAFISPPPGAFADGAAPEPGVDPARTMPPPGGDFGVGARAIVGGADDGGAAVLAGGAPVTVEPLAGAPPNAMINQMGTSRNATLPSHLFPWLTTPGRGLRSDDPPAPIIP